MHHYNSSSSYCVGSIDYVTKPAVHYTKSADHYAESSLRYTGYKGYYTGPIGSLFYITSVRIYNSSVMIEKVINTN